MHSAPLLFHNWRIEWENLKLFLGKLPFNKMRSLSNVAERINAFPTDRPEDFPFNALRKLTNPGGGGKPPALRVR